MRIRTLDQDFNGNQLEVQWGGNGDVYFTIYENEASTEARDNPMGRPVTVRVGMCGSGMHLPGNIGNLIAELAREFEKYKDSKFENDAYMKEFREECKKLKEEQGL
jgi:hypothetical protein